MKPSSFQAIATLLQSGSGLSIGPEKLYLLENRLGPLLKKHGLANLDALAERVRPAAPGQLPGLLEQEVIEAMTTNESFFSATTSPSRIFGATRCRSYSRPARRPPGCGSGRQRPAQARRPTPWR